MNDLTEQQQQAVNARVVGFDTCNNLFSPMWRKRGLIAFSSYARVATPADLGCTEVRS